MTTSALRRTPAEGAPERVANVVAIEHAGTARYATAVVASSPRVDRGRRHRRSPLSGIAIARELLRRQPDAIVTFVGTARGIEARAVPRAGFELDDSQPWPQGQVAGSTGSRA